MKALSQSQLISAMKHNGFTFDRLSTGLLFTRSGLAYAVTNEQMDAGCVCWCISDLSGSRIELISNTLAEWAWFKLPKTTQLSSFEQQMIKQDFFLSSL